MYKSKRIMGVVLITVFSLILMASVSVFSWGSRGTPCVGCHTIYDTTVQVSASVSELYVKAGEESSAFTVTVTGAGYDKGYTQAALRVPEGWGAGGDFINYVEDREASGIWDAYHTNERGDPDHTETFTGTIIVPSDATEGDYTVQAWGAGCDETNTKASDMVPITIHVTPPVALVHDIAITEVTVSPTEVHVGDPVYIDVTVTNEGNYSEIFDVYVYADINITVIGDEITIDVILGVSLEAGVNTTLSVAWNTTGVGESAYTISAEVLPVPDEVDTADNTLADGEVYVLFLSDIRGPENPEGSGLYPPDGVVDIWDFGFIGLAYGKTSADPDWNDYKIADIRGPENPLGSGLYPPDGQVDIWDFGYCGLEYGSSIWP